MCSMCTCGAVHAVIASMQNRSVHCYRYNVHIRISIIDTAHHFNLEGSDINGLNEIAESRVRNFFCFTTEYNNCLYLFWFVS